MTRTSGSSTPIASAASQPHAELGPDLLHQVGPDLPHRVQIQRRPIRPSVRSPGARAVRASPARTGPLRRSRAAGAAPCRDSGRGFCLDGSDASTSPSPPTGTARATAAPAGHRWTGRRRIRSCRRPDDRLDQFRDGCLVHWRGISLAQLFFYALCRAFWQRRARRTPVTTARSTSSLSSLRFSSRATRTRASSASSLP